jgi:uncharacterized protein YpmB
MYENNIDTEKEATAELGVDTGELIPTPPDADAEPELVVPAPAKKQNKLFTLFIILVIVVVAACAYFFFSYDKLPTDYVTNIESTWQVKEGNVRQDVYYVTVNEDLAFDKWVGKENKDQVAIATGIVSREVVIEEDRAGDDYVIIGQDSDGNVLFMSVGGDTPHVYTQKASETQTAADDESVPSDDTGDDAENESDQNAPSDDEGSVPLD